jgi:hydrogenase maturation protease
VTARLLIIGIGNRSRGDDALAPLLLDALRADGIDDDDAEFIEEYQLQVEHVLDLIGRAAVLFVDASHAPVPGGVALTPLVARADPAPASHALEPAAVIGVFERVQHRAPPPAWLLAIEGEAYGLGANLSAVAQQRLSLAIERANIWLDGQRKRPLHATR